MIGWYSKPFLIISPPEIKILFSQFIAYINEPFRERLFVNLLFLKEANPSF